MEHHGHSHHDDYGYNDDCCRAVDQLNNYDYQGSVLKVDYAQNGRGGPRGNNHMNGGGGGGPRGGPRADNRGPGGPGGPGGPSNNRGSGYPLRILVPSDFVGAIIGRKGQTIRNITTQSRARVDVHGKENSGLLEKVISIFGQPDNCTNACKEILKVMQQEAAATNRGEVMLKMLADDRYCGRIIGKEGKVIKKIREDTDTRITVSNVQEVPAMYPDRVITIKGSIDSMASSEGQISTKLRECYEKEMNQPIGPPNGMMMQPNMGGMPLMPGNGMYGMPGGPGPRGPYGNVMQQQDQGFYGPGPGGPGPNGNMYNNGGGPMQQQQQQPPHLPTTHEMCQISVPNSAVGAIIGAGGSNIKQIIRDSSAFVTIEQLPESQRQGKDEEPNPAIERIVTIKGSQESQWRAGYFIFEKLKQEGFAGNDDVRLRTIILVPRSMVGRVIGKGGKNVREIQRMTGAMIKLPEDPASQQEETVVEIFGNFMSTQSAMSRVRALVQQMQQQSPPGHPGINGHGPPMDRMDRRGPPMDRMDRMDRGPPRGPPRN